MLPGGGVLTIDPCSPGTINLSAANITVPGTGDLNPEKVINFKWLVPKDWIVSGYKSDGSSWIYSGQNVTANYPASATDGTIKVQGSIVVLGCTSETQESLPCDPITVKREQAFTLNANKSFVLCGNTTPVTFTVTPALPCAIYYWNNSQTPSTSNTFQVTPSGSSDVIATVNIVYGGKTATKQKTIQFKLFDPSNPPSIDGPAQVCSLGAPFTIKNPLPVNSIVWNYGPNLTITSGQNTSTCTFKSTSTGDSWISAKLVTVCGRDTVLTKTVGAGGPAIYSGNSLAYFNGGTYNNICNSQWYSTNMYVFPTGTRLECSRIAANLAGADFQSEPCNFPIIDDPSEIKYLRLYHVRLWV